MSGSGGSFFISGHEGCNAVRDQSDFINHTGQPFHYSGLVFTSTQMISGNQTMPLPTHPTQKGIHTGSGSFRITLLMYQQYCTQKRSLYYPHIVVYFLLEQS